MIFGAAKLKYWHGQVVSGSFFDEETEETREIAKRALPDVRLIAIPNDLRDSGGVDRDTKLVEYLREQIEDSL